MKHNTMLTVASLLSLLFLTLHITDDIVRGISKAEISTALLVLAVLLYGTIVLPERRIGARHHAGRSPSRRMPCSLALRPQAHALRHTRAFQ
jgi:hypothetical protein